MKRMATVVGFLMVVAACAEGSNGSASLSPPPTLSVPTTVAEMVEIPAPSGTMEPGAEILLTSGERVPEYEAWDPSTFSNPTIIDNAWLPMQPGTRTVYEGITREEGEVIPHQLIFVVTDLVKVIDGVPSLIRWDVDYSDGELVETEIAFYAQDDTGTVWRTGEYPEEWEEGQFLEAPAWLAGYEDARAGIAMPSEPRMGARSFSQGWGPAVDFTDRAYIWDMGTQTCVAVDCYDNVMIIGEFNNDEPGSTQLKYYAEGIGNVQVGWDGDDSSVEELELVEVTRLSPEEMADVREAALTLDGRAYILLEDLYGLTEPAIVMGAG